MNLTAPLLRPRLFNARWKGRLGRLMFAIATVAQLVGVLAGPMEHWRANTKLGAHVEESGSRLGHYQHNEATCSACAIGQMVAQTSRRADATPLWFESASVAPRVAEWVPRPSYRSQAAPRAPPTGSRIG